MMEQETNQKKGSVWYYIAIPNYRQGRCIPNPCRQLFYEILHRGITTHDIKDIYFLERLLPRSPVIDSYAMFRYIMILINSADGMAINKNFIIYLEKNLTKYDLSKPDVFVEILTYFVKNNQIKDAHELFLSRHKYMSYQTHRYVDYNEVNMACHGFLMNYIDWQKRIVTQDLKKFDVSIQGWLVNAMGRVKHANHNYELFIMCIVNVLLYYGLNKKAYLLLFEFQRTNPDNISGHLLLHKLIKKFAAGRVIGRRRATTNHDDDMEVDDSEIDRKGRRSVECSAINNFSVDEIREPFDIENYPIASDDQDILHNLIRLDPGRDEILELSKIYHSKIKTIQVIMDSLMEIPTMRDVSRWKSLKVLIDEVISSDDPNLINSMTTLWQTRYQPYWRLEDILRLAKESSESSMRTSHSNVIKRVIRNLKYNFDGDIPVDMEGEGTEDESTYHQF